MVFFIVTNMKPKILEKFSMQQKYLQVSTEKHRKIQVLPGKVTTSFNHKGNERYCSQVVSTPDFRLEMMK
jgi:hypothetical protein